MRRRCAHLLDPISESVTGRSKFYFCHVTLIATQFDSCPTKDVIRDMFNKDDDLMDIKEKEGFARCYEKVKSMMKKKKRK